MERLNPGKIRRKERKQPGRVREARRNLFQCFEFVKNLNSQPFQFDMQLHAEHSILPEDLAVGSRIEIDWVDSKFIAEILTIEVLDNTVPMKLRITAREIPVTLAEWIKKEDIQL